jgi:hypothetical protein
MGCLGSVLDRFLSLRDRQSTLSTRDSTMTTNLSRAAQAVLDVFNREARPEPHHQREAIAAALRAAADQAHPKAHIEDIDYVHQSYVHGWKDALDVILAIAAEIEA